MKQYITLLFLLLPSLGYASELPKQSMVVAANSHATETGVQILQQGGNAFDAAAAVALSLGVVEPGSSGIGGGGFFLLYIAKDKRYIMIDARETAPTLAEHGEVYDRQSSIDGPQAAGVPGLLAGIDLLREKYGKLSRKKITESAIRLAADGFKVGQHLQKLLQWRSKALNETAQHVFLNNGAVPKVGYVIKQTLLADTLRRYAKHGVDDFYRGETAKRLLADLQRDGGLIRIEDLQHYHAIERQPQRFDYQGFDVISASLPSSGGMVLAEIFGMLSNDDLSKFDETDRTHLLIEVMKRAYRDRNQFLGDADFVDVPDLLQPKRLAKLRASIDMKKATPSAQLGKQLEPMGNAVDTTHFSIMDDEGNIVSATLSINYGFGSGYMSPSTGILLNDEMDDFATKPGKANAYGLVQGEANAVAPGKRMLSSMTPTIVRSDDGRTLVLGTPGGSRIISMVLLTVVDFMLNDSNPVYWTWLPRFHHQFLPDIVQHEAHAFSKETEQELKKRGHKLKKIRKYGNMQAILWDAKHKKLLGLTDPRGEGKSSNLSKYITTNTR